jgi:uncharacterized membrane protein
MVLFPILLIAIVVQSSDCAAAFATPSFKGRYAGVPAYVSADSRGLHHNRRRTHVGGGHYNELSMRSGGNGRSEDNDVENRHSVLGPFLRSRRSASNQRHYSGSSDDDDRSEQGQRDSLIASQPAVTQRLAVAACFAALAVGTLACVELWFGPAQAPLGTEYFLTICETIFPIVFGLIFAMVAIGHFVFVENFARIVPPQGTWGGLWQLPAPFADRLGIPYADYQSYLSGLFEFGGGLWLLAGGLGYTDPSPPAFFLFLLTIAVTPANIYMYTHDASPGGIVPKLTTAGHVARFGLQCGLLSNFWIMFHPPLSI